MQPPNLTRAATWVLLTAKIVPTKRFKFPLRSIWLLAICLFLPEVNSHAAVTVNIGLNFTGTTYEQNDSQSPPPDPNGAIGPGRYLEFVNGSVAVYNRTNGASVKRKSDRIWWSDAGLNTSAIDVSDPRVIYDPLTQRWFASQVDFDPNAADPTTEANDFLLAVSTSSNPAGTWQAFMFQADPDNGYFADFPTLGLDGDAVYLSGDFYKPGQIPAGPGLVSIPKADLTNATPTIANMTWYGVMEVTNRGEVMQPVICFDGSESGNILAMGDIGDTSDPYSNIVCSVVQNAGTTSPTLSAPVSLTVDPYQVPDNDILGVPQFMVSQPDGTTMLQANDSRLSAKVFAVGGVLYAVHNTELNGRMAVQWYRIRAADHALLEQGTIADPNLDLFYPCIAANPNGVVMICCNGSSFSTYVSCYAYAGQTVNGHTTFGSSILLQSGVVSYHDLNDIFGQFSDDPTPSRWGDYNSLSVDAADPTQFWSITMYPSGVDSSGLDIGIWSTQITQLITDTRLRLTIASAGTNALVSWPADASGYQLQTTTNLLAADSWIQITSGISTNGLVITALVPETSTAKFFRLKL
jgi:hypothetical protein